MIAGEALRLRVWQPGAAITGADSLFLSLPEIKFTQREWNLAGSNGSLFAGGVRSSNIAASGIWRTVLGIYGSGLIIL